jgi:hypothetical protein
MKKALIFLVISAIMVSLCYAQTVFAAEEQSMPGGWMKIAVDDKAVTDSLAYLKQNFPVIRIEGVQSAYQQVVAGLNIKLVCKVSQMGNDEMWELIIYKDLMGNLQLTGARYHKP